MESGYTSDELSHFVGFSNPLDHEANYSTLLKVLACGWVSHAPHDLNWGKVSYEVDLSKSLGSGKLIDSTVTCYCDIPSDKLGLHVTKYGLFGLSFRRELLITYGARPVTYFPTSKTDQGSPNGQVILDDIESIYRSFRTHLSDPNGNADSTGRSLGKPCSTPEATIRALKTLLEKDFLAFLKPFNADAPLETFENYYLEREWRKYGNMRVDSDTVGAVFVGADFIERFQSDSPEYADRVQSLSMQLSSAKTRCLNCHKPLLTDRNAACPHCGADQKLHTEDVNDVARVTDSIEENW